MSKGKGKPSVSAAPKTDAKKVNRTRRSSFERKCLSKSVKRLFAGSSGVVFKLMDKVEKKSREKPKNTTQGDKK